MDKNQVYIKTELGEQAIKERQRLPQRELRIALIMIDGKSTVAELISKAGNTTETERAFGELEKTGLIRPSQDAKELALKLFNNRQEEEIDEDIDPDMLDIDEPTIPQPRVEQRQPVVSVAKTKPASRSKFPRDEVDEDGIRVLPGFVEPILSTKQAVRGTGPITLDRPQRPKVSGQVIKILKIIVTLPLALLAVTFRLFKNSETKKRVTHEVSAPIPDTTTTIPVKIKLPSRRKRKHLARKLTVLACMVAVIGVIVWLSRLDNYLPAIEKMVSGRINEPIKMRGLHISIAPKLGLIIDRAEIGPTAEVIVKKIRFAPSIFSLFGSTWMIQEIDAESLSLDTAWLSKLPLLLQANQLEHKVLIDRLRFSNIEIVLDRQNELGSLQGEIALLRSGGIEKISLNNLSDTMKLELTPVPSEGKYTVSMTATNWNLPTNPKMEFAYFAANGELSDKTLTMNDIDARLNDGKLLGKTKLSWNNGVAITGDINFRDINAHKMAAVFGSELFESGSLSGRLTFSATAQEYEKLANNVRLEGDFNVHKGLLSRVNLVEAARGASRGGWRNGETKFETITGMLSGNSQAYRFRNIKIDSGLVSVKGNLEIEKDKDLSGFFDVEIRAANNQIRVPLTLEGTFDQPHMYPARSFQIRRER